MLAGNLTLSGRRKWALVICVAVVGLGVGARFRTRLDSLPPREKTVARLLRDLRKQDSKLDLLHQQLWPKLPTVLGRQFPSLLPVRAFVTRRAAAQELESRGFRVDQAMPVLIAALQDPDLDVRRSILGMLTRLGRPATPAVPALIRFFKDPKNAGFADPRGEAALALVAIAPENPELIPIFASKLSDRDVNGAPTSIVTYVIAALLKIEPHADGGVPALIAAAEKGNPLLTAQIVDALGRRGQLDGEILAFVSRALTNADIRVRSAAITAVDQFGPAPSNAVPALVTLFHQIRVQTGDIEPPAGVPRRVAHAMDPQIMLRYGILPTPDALPERQQMLYRILCAFGKIGPTAAEAIPLFLSFDTEPNVRTNVVFRSEIAFARWRIDHAVDGLLPILEQASRDANPGVRARTAFQLDQIGERALPIVERLFRDSDPLARETALRSLAGLGAIALTPLTEALDDSSVEVRLGAITGLATLGAAAQPALPNLEARLNDPDSHVRIAAAKALKNITDPKGPTNDWMSR